MIFRPKQLRLTKVISASIVVISALLFQATAFAIAKGYSTNDSGLQSGMVVVLSTDSSNSSQVERANQTDSQRIVGVVTTIGDSLITVTSANTKVLVESEGEVDAYVADINGAIKKGDSLVMSPLKGILMKEAKSSDVIVGIASADSSGANSLSYTVKDGAKTKEVKIAKVKVNLNRLGAPNPNKTDTSLSRLGKAITGKDISEIRVIIAGFIFLLILVAEGGILYSGISSAMTAVGRNPLASKIIRKELLRVILIALFVLLVGIGAIYSILWI